MDTNIISARINTTLQHFIYVFYSDSEIIRLGD